MRNLNSTLLKRCFSLIVLTAPVLCSAFAFAQATPEWQELTTDLELLQLELYPQAVLTPELLFVRTALKHFRVGVIRAADFGSVSSNVKTLVERSQAVVGINANFFDENEKPLGLIVSGGMRYQKIHSGGDALTAVFQSGRRGVTILGRDSFNYETAVEAIQAGPRLLQGGKKVAGIRDLSTQSRRAGVCIDTSGRLLFFISTGLVGISFGQMQDLLLHNAVGCNDALNLDGGGSAQLYISPKVVAAAKSQDEVLVQGHDNVPVLLGLFVKPTN